MDNSHRLILGECRSLSQSMFFFSILCTMDHCNNHFADFLSMDWNLLKQLNILLFSVRVKFRSNYTFFYDILQWVQEQYAKKLSEPIIVWLLAHFICNWLAFTVSFSFTEIQLSSKFSLLLTSLTSDLSMLTQSQNCMFKDRSGIRFTALINSRNSIWNWGFLLWPLKCLFGRRMYYNEMTADFVLTSAEGSGG